MGKSDSKARLLIGGALLLALLCIVYFLFNRDDPEPTPAAEPVTATPSPAVRESDPLAQPDETPAVLNAVAPVPLPPEPTGYQLLVRVWTRAGERVAGAEVFGALEERMWERAGVTEGEYVTAVTDGNGEAMVSVSHGDVIYSLRGEKDGLVAYSAFGFFGQVSETIDLVLQPVRSLTGRCIDGQGEAVAGVTVRVRLEERSQTLATVSSDVEGHFVFKALMSGRYVVTAEKEGYASTVSDPVAPGEDLIVRMGSGGAVAGTVVAIDTGRPVPDMAIARVRVAEGREDKQVATTDVQGKFRFEALTMGNYYLRSADDVYALRPVETTVVVDQGKIAQVTLQAEATASVQGMVVDEESGAGIPNVAIRASLPDYPNFRGPATQTDPTGAFAITGLAAARYTIRTRIPAGYGWSRMGDHYTDVSLAPGEARTDLQFVLRRMASLRGQVVNEDGSGASGATVRAWVYGANRESVTWSAEQAAGQDGYFTLPSVPTEEPIHLQARLRSARSEAVGPVHHPRDGEAAPVQLTLRDAETTTLSGRVLDGAGMPVTASVSCVERNRSSEMGFRHNVRADGDGYFLIFDVLPGTYQLNYGRSLGGFVDATHSFGPLEVEAGVAQRDLVLHLDGGGFQITGTVRRADGSVVPNYMLEIERFEEADYRGYELYGATRADAEGNFVFENMDEGDYRIHSYSNSGAPWYQDARAGEHVEIVLPAEPE